MALSSSLRAFCCSTKLSKRTSLFLDSALSLSMISERFLWFSFYLLSSSTSLWKSSRCFWFSVVKSLNWVSKFLSWAIWLFRLVTYYCHYWISDDRFYCSYFSSMLAWLRPLMISLLYSSIYSSSFLDC